MTANLLDVFFEGRGRGGAIRLCQGKRAAQVVVKSQAKLQALRLLCPVYLEQKLAQGFFDFECSGFVAGNLRELDQFAGRGIDAGIRTCPGIALVQTPTLMLRLLPHSLTPSREDFGILR
jgi:hypothetical protein